MAWETKNRKDDEQLLHMLELRDMGYSSGQIGLQFGMTPGRVRTMTNRVYAAMDEEADD